MSKIYNVDLEEASQVRDSFKDPNQSLTPRYEQDLIQNPKSNTSLIKKIIKKNNLQNAQQGALENIIKTQIDKSGIKNQKDNKRKQDKRRTGIQSEKEMFTILTHSKQQQLQKDKNMQKDKWYILYKACAISLKAIKMLKEASSVNCWDIVNEDHIQSISDKASDQQEFAKKIQKLHENNLQGERSVVIYQTQQKTNFFSADDNFLFFWQIIKYMLLFYQMLLFPVKSCWKIDIHEVYWTVLPLIIMVIEIFINFNTSFYFQGLIITDKKKIFKNYIMLQFWLDAVIVATLCFSLIVQNYDLNFIFLLKIHQISSITTEIDERFSLQEKFPMSWTLLKLICQIFYAGHLFGSIFFYIAKLEMENGNTQTWVNAQYLESESRSIQYLNSIYFAFITMITVGYGDITPKTWAEKLYVIFMTLLSSGQFAYTINIIHSLFQDQAKRQAMHKQILKQLQVYYNRERKQVVSKYMNERKINSNVQLKIFKYLDYIQHKENEKPEKGLNILDQVSTILKDQVFKDYYGGILNNCKLMKNNFSSDFLSELSLIMHENLFGPGELIFNQNDYDGKLYFLIKGQVQTYIENTQSQQITTINIFEDGDFFGTKGFFSLKGRDFSARSVSTSTIVFFDIDNFLKIIKNYQKDFEVFCQFKDQINIYGVKIYENCHACNKTKHTILDCPYIHLIKSRKYALLKHRYTVEITERKKCRRKLTKFSTLKKIGLVKKCLKKQRKNLIQEIRKEQKKNQFQQKLSQSSNGSDQEDLISEEDQQHEEDSIIQVSESDLSFFINNPGFYFREDGEKVLIENRLDDIEYSIDSDILEFQDHNIETNGDQDKVTVDHEHDNQQEQKENSQNNSINHVFELQKQILNDSFNQNDQINQQIQQQQQQIPQIKFNNSSEFKINLEQKEKLQINLNQQLQPKNQFNFSSQKEITIASDEENKEIIKKQNNIQASILETSIIQIQSKNLIQDNQNQNDQILKTEVQSKKLFKHQLSISSELNEQKISINLKKKIDRANKKLKLTQKQRNYGQNVIENKDQILQIKNQKTYNINRQQLNEDQQHQQLVLKQQYSQHIKLQEQQEKLYFSSQLETRNSQNFKFIQNQYSYQQQLLENDQYLRKQNQKQSQKIQKSQNEKKQIQQPIQFQIEEKLSKLSEQQQKKKYIDQQNIIEKQQLSGQINKENAIKNYKDYQQFQENGIENNYHSQLFYYEMDSLKEFQKYFFHCNYSNVIKKVKIIIKSNRRKSLIEKQKDRVLQGFKKTFQLQEIQKNQRNATFGIELEAPIVNKEEMGKINDQIVNYKDNLKI